MTALPCLPALHIGTEEDCRGLGFGSARGFAVLHAAKYPCHADMTGLPPRGDQRYLAHRVSASHLTLNMIDPPVPLFSVELFQRALDFLDERLALGPVLIHCNQGFSRAPSLALVYLAKRAKGLHGHFAASFDGYAGARGEFAAIYPAYAPGAGLVQFLTERWKEIA